jgi:hypothetical protein
MSYFNSGKDIPRVPTAPDHAAIQRLGEELASIAREKRRRRSLQTCHRPAHRPAKPEYLHDSGAYVPQFSARLLNDPNLSDGAGRGAVRPSCSRSPTAKTGKGARSRERCCILRNACGARKGLSRIT